MNSNEISTGYCTIFSHGDASGGPARMVTLAANGATIERVRLRIAYGCRPMLPNPSAMR